MITLPPPAMIMLPPPGRADRPVALSRSGLRELLAAHDLSPSRALGQNFLCDQGMVDKIVRLADVGPEDHVLEIGPGLGSLTGGLCATGATVVAVEIDRYLIPVLTDQMAPFGDSGRLTVINADVRELLWPQVLGQERWVVVANLPYNIATPLILDLLATQPQLERWVVMVQREAGERLVAGPGSRTYGIPSVLLAYWAEARIVGSVPPELFLPRPNVASVLVEIVRRPEVDQDGSSDGEFAVLSRLVRTGFGQRRKMLRRSLAGLVDDDSFKRAGIEPTRRPEELSLDEWRHLTAVVGPDPAGF